MTLIINIAIVGAGQLGSRHLQALSLLQEEMNIFLVDPIEISLEVSKKRFDEVDKYNNKNIYLLNSIKKLPISIEFAIIATTSLHRLSVLKTLFTHATVKYLLLEKFLFPFVEEYEEAQRLIEISKTITYVNCTRRQWESYKQLKDKVKDSQNISLIARGDNWNLASNSIHLLDLFFYLTGKDELNINTNHLSNNIVQNKRQGYVEYLGTIFGDTRRGNHIELTCGEGDSFNLIIEIKADDVLYQIDEANEIIQFEGTKERFPICYQSQLTNRVLQQLRETDTCDLTPFVESAEIHLTLLNAFNNKFSDREGIIT